MDYCEEALEIAHEIGDRRGEGAHNNLGEAFQTLEEPETALACYRLGVTVGREIEDHRVEGWLENVQELKEAIGPERYAALEQEVAGREDTILREALEAYHHET